jgi:hypothetical protein
MKLVARRIRSTAEIPSVSAKPNESALPTVFLRHALSAIRREIGQRHSDVPILDAFRRLKQSDLAIAIDALNGSRHNRLALSIIAPKAPQGRTGTGQALRAL